MSRRPRAIFARDAGAGGVMPPLPFYHCRGHCDAIGHGNDSPFSRCTFASEFCLHALRKPFVPPSKKEGGGAPISASTGVRPAAERKPASVCGERHRFLPRTVRDQSGGALAFRRPTAVMRRGPYLDSAPGRASWNHRIQTGGPSPAPVQPAPGSPVTRRTVDAQNRPDARCIAALPGTALVPLSKVPSRKAPP